MSRVCGDFRAASQGDACNALRVGLEEFVRILRKCGRAHTDAPLQELRSVCNGMLAQVITLAADFREARDAAELVCMFSQSPIQYGEALKALVLRILSTFEKVAASESLQPIRCHSIAAEDQRCEGPPNREPRPLAIVPDPMLRRTRGRPSKISDERKKKALNTVGNRNRAKILYGVTFPSPQQVKNVPAILRHYRRTHDLDSG